MPKTKGKRRDSEDSSSDTSVEDKVPPAKKPKTSSGSRTNDDEPTWSLEGKKFAKVRAFKGKVYVDIREYYEKNGDLLPGKKGISLSGPQWQKLKQAMGEIDEALKEK